TCSRSRCCRTGPKRRFRPTLKTYATRCGSNCPRTPHRTARHRPQSSQPVPEGVVLRKLKIGWLCRFVSARWVAIVTKKYGDIRGGGSGDLNRSRLHRKATPAERG